MAYVVTENCIKCKYTDCVDVCPVDCFHEGPNFLVIDPAECIDCTLCVAECPAEAIMAEDDVPEAQLAFIALNAEPAVVETFIKRMDGELKCAVKAAKDGTPLTPGTIHIAYDPDRHVVIEPGSPAKLRLIDRDPVDGVRPSANLLFGSIARGSVPATAAILTGMGADGAKGLKLMRDSGCKTFVQDRSTAMVAEAPTAAMDVGAAESELPLDDLGPALIASCNSA